MHLIVGLGNPGEKFVHTRHNLGFEVVDEFRRKHELGEWAEEKKFKAEVVKGEGLVVIRPLTYMNRSGMAVAKVAHFYKIKPADIIVVHDELDLLIGHMKIRIGGSDAGHHGVESVITELGSENFIRLRLGIGAEKALAGEHKAVDFNAEKYVIDQFGQGESHHVKAMIKRGIKAIEAILKEGVDKAQNQFN